ncbi:MAG: rhodanese-like domain-containing protein [Candidatus Eremiobacteraeota bacterium]|nr:rhodanese-like domain-containing protein [Candidatus Eremiobacteraeota bacterium]
MKKNEELTPFEAREHIARGALLLDVRENDEWERGHVDGARHIPLAELPLRLGELPSSATIVCMCRSGRRSAEAQSILMTLPSIGSAYNLSGGILRWVKDGLPIIGTAEE